MDGRLESLADTQVSVLLGNTVIATINLTTNENLTISSTLTVSFLRNVDFSFKNKMIV